MNAVAHAGKFSLLKESGRQDETRFLNPATIPWTPWIMGGIDFKLLNYEGERCTLLFRSEAHPPLKMHQHVGATELYVIRGSIEYAGQRCTTGGYMYEPPETTHQPSIPEYSEFLVVFHGDLRGENDDGSEHRVKASDYFEMAARNNAVGHLKPRAS